MHSLHSHRKSPPLYRRSYLSQANEVAIIASGPSLHEDDVSAIKQWRAAAWPKRQVLAVSTMYKRASWADAVYAADHQWFDVYGEDLFAHFLGEIWSGTRTVSEKWKRVHYVERTGNHRVPGDIQSIGDGNNSGTQAIMLAAQIGVPKIILTGFDFKHAANGDTHCHAPHPAPLRNAFLVETWLYALDDIAADLKREGVTVLNATRDTAITQFPRVELSEVLK